MLIARGHGCARPAHDRHDRPLGYAKNEQHGRRGVTGVVQAGVADAGALQECLPFVVVAVGCDRPTDEGSVE